MGILHRLFGKKDFLKKKEKNPKRGNSITLEIQLDYSAIEQINQKFIAFDVETTGLSSSMGKDRIIEIGAVIFENGQPIREFSTLVNPGINIPPEATRVNNITNEMIANAPSEREVYHNFVDFIGDAINGQTAFCAHNAPFDMAFLSETLARLGYDAKMFYVDTLKLSRSTIKGLENYKLGTVANYFNINNENAHRASSDAEVCGKILLPLLRQYKSNKEQAKIKEKERIEKMKPSDEELAVCKYIQEMIVAKGVDIEYLRCYKQSGGYISITYLYNIIKFKLSKKQNYIIIDKKVAKRHGLAVSPCTKSEGEDYVRYEFKEYSDLDILSSYIFSLYMKAKKGAEFYMEDHLIEALESIKNFSRCDVTTK